MATMQKFTRHSAAPLMVAAILFILALAVTGWVGYRLNAANAWVAHTYAVMAQMDDVYVTVQHIESDMRGFVLTGDRGVREQFSIERSALDKKLNNLGELVKDNPRNLTAELRNQIKYKVDFCDEIERTYERSPEQALLLARSPVNAVLMNNVRDVRHKMMQREQQLLQERTADLDSMKTMAVPIATILVATALGLLYLAISTTRSVLAGESLRADQLATINTELKESQKLFENFMHHSPALAWMKDSTGRMVWANSNFYENFGLTAEQVIGKRAEDFLRVVTSTIDEADRHVYEDQSVVDYIIPLHLPDGSERFYFISKFPIETSKGELIGAIAIDVHDQHVAEQQVGELNRQLQDHVRQLEAARDKALEASALKSAFVANISHEIRTPLSGIIGMNELLLNTNLDHDQRSLADTVHESSLSLLTVLNDILDLSKIEAGKMTFEQTPFKLKWLLQDSIRLMSAAAAAKGLELRQEFEDALPAQVVGDPERVRQVLLNLIGNAVKFTSKGSITVRASVIEENDERATVRFSVTDTGIGIAPEDRKFLFTPFAQVDNSSTRRFGGTGLGLTICKKLVSFMDGNMGVDSTPGVGSTFYFTIPFAKHAPIEDTRPKPTPLPTRPRAMGHKSVLVVEDNPVLQHVAVMQLTNLGVSSRVAHTGPEALEAIQAGTFDMVLMDVHLPQMSGYDVTTRVRQLEQGTGRRTPIIAMTAGAMEQDKQRCLAAGMDDYMSKPVNVEALRRMVEKWTGGADIKTA